MHITTTSLKTLSVNDAIIAARTGNLTTLGAWLDQTDTADAHDVSGWTPLLWASVRGHAGAVELLLERGADIAQAHRISGALPIHMAGHSGDPATARALLEHQPDQLDAVWDLNGHTALLQAVFYDHRALAAFLLQRGADTSITTARGLGPMELAAQFQNGPMMEILRPYDTAAEIKAAYYRQFLERITPPVPPEERAAQALSDRLVQHITEGLRKATESEEAEQEVMAGVRDLVERQGADVNRLGGALRQPPLVVTVTGNNGFPPIPGRVRLRSQLASYLLQQGADPTLHEKHPMGAQTVIRAAVFNHLEILRMCEHYISPGQLTDAINEIPMVNGLTALHDSVLRASTAAPEQLEGYLEQIRWFVAHGGRSDIEDFSGRTQRRIAEETTEPEVRSRILDALSA